MTNNDDDRSFHISKKPEKTYVSKSFPAFFTGKKLRIASKVLDHEEGLAFAVVNSEVAIRTTPKGRFEIKATFLEDSREITTLTIQKFNSVSGPSDRDYFSFVGGEINTLLSFILAIRAISLGDGRKMHLADEELRELILNDRQARHIFSENEELFVQIAQSDHLKRDLVAIGYRRKQLERFERLLHDKDFYDDQKVCWRRPLKVSGSASSRKTPGFLDMAFRTSFYQVLMAGSLSRSSVGTISAALGSVRTP
jgi:hypothetical protein